MINAMVKDIQPTQSYSMSLHGEHTKWVMTYLSSVTDVEEAVSSLVMLMKSSKL